MNQILLHGITLEQLAESLVRLLNLNPISEPNPQPENDLLTREEVCKLLSINKTYPPEQVHLFKNYFFI